MPLGRGEPLVLASSVESVALLALVLRQGPRCTRRLACVTRTGHSLLSVLPPKKLREPANLFRRLRELGRSLQRQRRGSHLLALFGARCRFLARLGVARRALSLLARLGVGCRHLARLAASTPLSDSECCESANK